MKVRSSQLSIHVCIYTLLLILAASSIAESKDKKKHGQRGMLESMQSVPCGAKERGLTGLGSVFGSVGVQHVDSHEQLCPQYLLRTDEMDYHIRPLDMKHAAVLPVGQEAEFKIKKDRLLLRVPDDGKKTRAYQVVSMQPVNTEKNVEGTAYHTAERPVESRPPSNPSRNREGDGDKATGQAIDPPPQE